MRAAAILLLATALITAGCRSQNDPAPKEIPEPAGGYPLLGLGKGREPSLRVVVVKKHAAREEFAMFPDRADGAGSWRSLADRVYRYPRSASIGILLAYPDERHRPPASSDPGRRAIRLVFIGSDEGVVADRVVTLDGSRTLLDPGRPFRYLLVLRPESPVWMPRPAVSTRVRVPREAQVGVEPEWRPLRDPPPRRVTVKGVPLEIEIADTPEKRSVGLMYRHELPEGRGMLFLYPEDDTHSFWMVNTRIALDLAYLDHTGLIRSIHRLEPHDPKGKSSGGPVRMALEVPAGWFARHGIRAGDRVDLGDAAPK